VGSVLTFALLAFSLVSIVLTAANEDGWRGTVAKIVIAGLALFAAREAFGWWRRTRR
jgi:hypothetical protein